jgi:hypothetical protein
LGWKASWDLKLREVGKMELTIEESQAKTKKELHYLRERIRSQRQMIRLMVDLAETLVRICITYWVFNLAIYGVRYLNPVWNDWAQLQVALIWCGFSMWAVLYLCYGTFVYRSISDDGHKGAAILVKKFQSASEAWRKG